MSNDYAVISFFVNIEYKGKIMQVYISAKLAYFNHKYYIIKIREQIR